MNEQELQQILEGITGAVKLALGDKWQEAQGFAESEAKKFANNIAELAQWKLEGKVDEEQARVLLRMHQRSMKMVLTALEGISLVLAEKAINAAIDAVGDMANGMIGWRLF